MSDFDPYYKWLGIPPKEQPPNHYRLLAIELYEGDREVIEAASNRQMLYLQELAAGPDVVHSQRLMNEMATARVCLLDPKKKRAYDERLKTKLSAGMAVVNSKKAGPATKVSSGVVRVAKAIPEAPANQQTASARPAPVRVAASPASAAAPQVATSERSSPVASARRRKKSPLMPAAVVVLMLLALGGLSYFLIAGFGDNDELALDDPDYAEIVGEDSDDVDDGDRPPTTADAPGPTKRDDNGDHVEPAVDGTPKDAPGPKSADTVDLPELIQMARTAHEGKDIETMIRHYQAYLERDPQPPFKAEAEKLLPQAQLAVSDDRVLELLRAQLAKTPDDVVVQMANDGNRHELPEAPIDDPVLLQVFRVTINRNVPRAVSERREKIAAAKPAADPSAAITASGDAKPEPKPISDPKELLASKGLSLKEKQWRLDDESQLSTHNAALQELRKDLRAKQLALFDIQRKVEDIRRKLVASDASKAAFQKRTPRPPAEQVALGQQYDLFVSKNFDEPAAKIKEAIEAGEKKIDTRYTAVKESRQKLEDTLAAAAKAVDDIQQRYQQLQQDAGVKEALEKLGGRLGNPPEEIKRLRRTIAITKEKTAAKVKSPFPDEAFEAAEDK